MKITLLSSGEERTFNGNEISIGRETDNNLQLLIDGVSRYHAKFAYSKEMNAWKIIDLMSTNGVLLNGEKVEKVEVISIGDIIKISQEKIRIDDLSLSNEIENSPKKNILFTEVIDFPNDLDAGEPIKEETNNNINVTENDIKDISNFKINSFSELIGNAKNAINSKQENSDKSKKSIMSNRLFYTIVFCVIIVGLAFFIKGETDKVEPTNHASSQENSKDTLQLRYVKRFMKEDNVFRFELIIDNNQATFIIDDLKSQLRYGPITKEISQIDLKRLIQEINSSDFLKLKGANSGTTIQSPTEFFDLNIILNNKHNRVIIADAALPIELIDVANALTTLADSFNMPTVSLSPEELLEQAKQSFDIAEDKLANYESNLSFLRDAITEYNLVIEYLKGHSPEPNIRKIATKNLERAKDLRKKYFNNLRTEFFHYRNRKDFASAKDVLTQMMNLVTPDSKEYRAVKIEIIKVDANLKNTRGKGR